MPLINMTALQVSRGNRRKTYSTHIYIYTFASIASVHTQGNTNLRSPKTNYFASIDLLCLSYSSWNVICQNSY